MNKTKLVLDWLKAHAGISSMDAFEHLGVTRLAAVIFELRKKGYDIETVIVEGKDRYGNKSRYARYYLR